MRSTQQPAQCMHAKLLQSLLCDPVDSSRQVPLSMGFSRQEYWSGLPCPPPGDLPEPGIEATSLTSLALAGRFFTTSTIWEAHPAPYLGWVDGSCHRHRLQRAGRAARDLPASGRHCNQHPW